MSRQMKYISLLPVYLLILLTTCVLTLFGSRAVTVLSADAPVVDRKTVVVDAGHGGVDGGATSCTGVLESKYNLEIALRLNDLLHLLGIDTVMIRTTDCSVHTNGETIGQKKISDLKERVRIVNNTKNGILVSIHQNYYSERKYHGAQVFYSANRESAALAELIQSNVVLFLNQGSNRKIKKATGIYLMENITQPGVLIECGFLSNTTEEARLRDAIYQKKLCCVIAGSISAYLHSS